MAPPRLSVMKNRLVQQGGAPVRLKGLNRSGFQHKPSLLHIGMSYPEGELRGWRDEWKAQIIRFPVAQDSFLGEPDYRGDLDQIVRTAGQEGLYLMLEFHGTTKDLSMRLPDDATDDAWAEMARRYGGESHVIFDLWNEPHDTDWRTWRPIAERLARRIRDEGASETLIIVGGLDWAYDLSDLMDPGERIEGLGAIAYATHPYPWKGRPAHGPAEWDEKFGRVSREVPVLVTEFGADGSGEQGFGFPTEAEAEAWLRQLLRYIDALGLSALAWSAGDKPQLTLGWGGMPVWLPGYPPDVHAPTRPFGTVVREWMRGK